VGRGRSGESSACKCGTPLSAFFEFGFEVKEIATET
jgi:hypothetical protein